MLHYYYRPQRSCGQGYVFTRVCDSVQGGSPENPPSGTRRTPAPRTRQTPRQGETPRTRQTPRQGDPPWTRETHPPGPGRPPPREEDCSIRSMSGRYASYWNAFLLLGFVYTKRQRQRWHNPAMTLVILFSLKTVESLENGLQTRSGGLYCFHWEQNCKCHSSVDADAWYKWALTDEISISMDFSFQFSRGDLCIWVSLSFCPSNFTEFSDRRLFEPATSCARGQGFTTLPARHGSSNEPQFMLQWFIRFPESTGFAFKLFSTRINWMYTPSS